MKIILDLATEEWNLDIPTKSRNNDQYDNLEIDFIDNGNSYVQFTNLTFGFIIKENTNVLYDISFPPENITYLSSDQDYLESYPIDSLVPGISYSLEVWAKNNDKNYSSSFEFLIPRPKQPDPSWVWDEENGYWIPPMETAALYSEMQKRGID